MMTTVSCRVFNRSWT